MRSAAFPVHRHSVPQVALDAVLVALAYYLAYCLRFDSGIPPIYEDLLQRMMRPRTVVHAPLKKDCLACHAGHSAKEPHLLAAAPAALCAKCHDAKAPKWVEAHRGMKVDPARCTSCHDPHLADRKGLPRQVRHQPYLNGDCGTCHGPSDPKKAGAAPGASTRIRSGSAP